MQTKHNTVLDQVNSLTTVFKKLRPKPNKNFYSWADSLFRSGKIKGTLLHSLKAIIACLNIDRPTIAQINKARTKSASFKFAQSSPVTDRTLRRHIQELETLELIGVVRSRDERRNSRNAYSIKAPEEVLSYRSEDTMSSSITLATSDLNNNTKIDIPKGKLDTKLKLDFNEKQLAILATLAGWGTWKGRAIHWLQQYSTQELQEAITYVKNKNVKNPGGYMHLVIRELDERKRALKTQTTTRPQEVRKMENPHLEAEQRARIQKQAEKRLAARGITDPRMKFDKSHTVDTYRNFDCKMAEEIRVVTAELAHRYAKN